LFAVGKRKEDQSLSVRRRKIPTSDQTPEINLDELVASIKWNSRSRNPQNKWIFAKIANVMWTSKHYIHM